VRRDRPIPAARQEAIVSKYCESNRAGTFDPIFALPYDIAAAAATGARNKKAALPFAAVAAFRSKGSYFLVSSVPVEVVSSDFFVLLFLDDFFFILVEVSVFAAS
jgi:hypothetical protein